MLERLKEKIAALVANAVIIGGVFGVVVPEAVILDAVNATAIAVAAILATVAGWQAAVWKG
jgi:uncharacterized membrane protein YraQ (UPF0718 family)